MMVVVIMPMLISVVHSPNIDRHPPPRRPGSSSPNSMVTVARDRGVQSGLCVVRVCGGPRGLYSSCSRLCFSHHYCQNMENVVRKSARVNA